MRPAENNTCTVRCQSGSAIARRQEHVSCVYSPVNTRSRAVCLVPEDRARSRGGSTCRSRALRCKSLVVAGEPQTGWRRTRTHTWCVPPSAVSPGPARRGHVGLVLKHPLLCTSSHRRRPRGDGRASGPLPLSQCWRACQAPSQSARPSARRRISPAAPACSCLCRRRRTR